MEIEVKKLANSEVELAGELPAEEFGRFRVSALNKLANEHKIDGFRDGRAPEKILEQKLGSEKILWEMAELALREYYPKILAEKKVDALGRPEIVITKLAAGNPLGFKIKTAVTPTFTLPAYQEIAKRINKKANDTPAPAVEEKEIDQELENLRRAMAKKNQPTEMAEINDDFAKKIGPFATLAALRENIRQHLLDRKNRQNKDRQRLAVIDGLVAETTMAIPRILVDREIEKMMQEMKTDIANLGLDFKNYLAHLKKTEDELKNGWRLPAEKRAAAGLIIGAIADQEKINPTTEELQAEVEHLIKTHPEINTEQATNYLTGIIRQEKCLQFLENLL